MLMHACNLGRGPPTTLIYFVLHGVIAPAFYKGLHEAEARPVQKGGYRATRQPRVLRVVLTEMLNIP